MQRQMANDGIDDVLDEQNVSQTQYGNVLDAMFHAPDLETMLACADDTSLAPSLAADARHTVQLIEMFSTLRCGVEGRAGDHVTGKACLL